MPTFPYVVSACLVGFAVRYDGRSKYVAALGELFKAGKCLPICPECLGGLGVPRLPCELLHGRVLRRDGVDVTKFFEEGVRLAIQKTKACQAKIAIVQNRSPSCGCGLVYDGTFSGSLIKGHGLWTHALLVHGITVYPWENFAVD
ncbi:MAG: DUF523 domain-containing protein [Desulfovibrionaceae bacterium]|nr:DUF523 domain-containing protein [Desulfovibrionaceae bacterium]